MGGGIGVTPMIAFAHECYAKGIDFELHYSVSIKSEAAFVRELQGFDWADKVHFHFSDQGSRADFGAILSDHSEGSHVYACGPERFMSGVMDAAKRQGFPEDACHTEYFSVPDLPDYENHDFTLRLAKSGKEFTIPPDKTAAEVLIENGYPIDLKCSDGICGVCKCGLKGGEVEHRDFVLSNTQRHDSIILCQSRASKKDGVVEIDL